MARLICVSTASLQPQETAPPQAVGIVEGPSTVRPEVAQAPAKRGRTRRAITSRFKGFDDGFDPDDLPQSSRKVEFVSQTNDLAEEDASQKDSVSMKLRSFLFWY